MKNLVSLYISKNRDIYTRIHRHEKLKGVNRKITIRRPQELPQVVNSVDNCKNYGKQIVSRERIKHRRLNDVKPFGEYGIHT